MIVSLKHDKVDCKKSGHVHLSVPVSVKIGRYVVRYYADGPMVCLDCDEVYSKRGGYLIDVRPLRPSKKGTERQVDFTLFSLRSILRLPRKLTLDLYRNDFIILETINTNLTGIGLPQLHLTIEKKLRDSIRSLNRIIWLSLTNHIGYS